MRLIDADKIDFNKIFVGASEFAQDTRNAAQMLIDEQPTAYNIDKVVSVLEKMEEKALRVQNYDVSFYATGQIHKAIEIVKQGGVSDDVQIKQGKWIFDNFTAQYGNPYRCSCCNEEFGNTYNYCPNCGVAMKEVE